MAFPTHPLTETQEAEAKVLAERIHEFSKEDFLQLARLLVGKPTKELFGQTEFQVRDILLRAGAKAYTQYLAEKKTATTSAASSVPIASEPRNSTAIAAKNP